MQIGFHTKIKKSSWLKLTTMIFSGLQVAKFLNLSTRNLIWLPKFKINKDHANVAYILTIA